MKSTLSAKETIAIGLMLFALFFGAGNMIFPPELGQAAGEMFESDGWLSRDGCRFAAFRCCSCRFNRDGCQRPC